MMETYDELVLETFLKQQRQLVPEVVAENPEEAEEFLENCMAVVCNSMEEVREYFDEVADISGLGDDELLEQSEVFAIPDGRYLIVEG